MHAHVERVHPSVPREMLDRKLWHNETEAIMQVVTTMTAKFPTPEGYSPLTEAEMSVPWEYVPTISTPHVSPWQEIDDIHLGEPPVHVKPEPEVVSDAPPAQESTSVDESSGTRKISLEEYRSHSQTQSPLSSAEQSREIQEAVMQLMRSVGCDNILREVSFSDHKDPLQSIRNMTEQVKASMGLESATTSPSPVEEPSATPPLSSSPEEVRIVSITRVDTGETVPVEVKLLPGLAPEHQRPEHSPVEDDETAAVVTWETDQEDSGDGVNPTIKNKRKLEDERDNVKKSRCQEETQAVESLPAPPPPPRRSLALPSTVLDVQPIDLSGPRRRVILSHPPKPSPRVIAASMPGRHFVPCQCLCHCSNGSCCPCRCRCSNKDKGCQTDGFW